MAGCAPQRLTDDSLPDGRAALAGDVLGANLAWVCNTAGDIAPRTAPVLYLDCCRIV